MGGFTVTRIDDLPARYGGGFKLMRAGLGVESFGMAILDFPPNADRHPEHDHRGDGQEEVYLVLRGAGEIELEGRRVAIDPDVAVRVPPETPRRLLAGPEGMRVLALGGVPGQVYDPPELSKPENLDMRG